MSDITEVTAEIKKFNEALQFVQTEFKNNKGEMNDSIKKAQDEIGKAADAIQEIQTKQIAEQKALQGEIDAMKKKLARGGQQGVEQAASEAEILYKSQFNRFMRKGVAVDDSLIGDLATEICTKTFGDLKDPQAQIEMKTILEGSNPDGGYFIRPDRASFMATQIFETSPMRQIANVVPVISNELEVVIDDDEADGAWVGEADTRSEQGTPQIGLLRIPVQEVYTILKSSQRALDDIRDGEGWLVGKATSKLSRLENTGFVLGDNVQQPQGFMTLTAAAAANTYERGKIGTYTSTGTSAVLDKPADFKIFQNLVKEDYQANATWLMQRSTFSSITTLMDTAGQFIFNSFFMNEKDRLNFLGKPVLFMADMATVAANSLSVAYGDFRTGYTIVDRMGFRVVRDNITAKGFVLFYVYKRVGGAVTNYDSFKIMKTKA